MNKNKLKKLIALCVACAGAGVFALGGCASRGEGHVHTWSTKYYQDGAAGHHRVSTCLDHATVNGEIEAHDGDVCSKCGYVKEGSGAIAVTKVEITGNSSVKEGGKIQLGVTVTPSDATATEVTWQITQGGEHAQIDQNGVLTGTSKGSVTVKATVGGVSGTHDVEVIESGSAVVHVTSVVLDKGTLELKEGESATLTATVKPEEADDQTVTWSSDSAAATVKNGVVTAVSEGTANITVTTNDGNKTATCVVTVKAADPGKDPSKPGGDIETPPDPVIEPVAGGPTITKASAGELEAAYVEWTAAPNAEWYNVYVSPEGAGSWTKLDAPLVRQYKDYYRADAVGLKAGTYDIKVVPVDGSGSEAAEYAAPAEKITVYAHERAGFGFVGGSSSGAYNDDGTLKSNAIVVYVTEETMDSVTVTAPDSKGNNQTYTGVQGIISAMKAQKGINVPVCVRIVGNIPDPAGMPNGDLYVDDVAQLTIEGIGNDATCNGFGIVIKNSSNVEVRNLGFMNCNSKEGDNVGMQQANDHIWVHNCDMFYGHAGSDADQIKGDGALDSKGTNYSTYSYNHFWDNGKCNLLGNGNSELVDGGVTHITYHHNWYDHSDSRHPRIRSATVHIYNNYFDGNAKYGVGASKDSDAFVENNYFRSTASMKPILSANQGSDILYPNEKGEYKSTFGSENGGTVKAYGNVYDCPADKLKLLVQSKDKNEDTGKGVDCWEASSRAEKVPASYTSRQGGNTYNNFDTADDMYEYTVDTAQQAKDKVTRYAGRVDGGDFKWTFNNATEDSNYAVITELKSAIVAYDDKILKIGK